VRNRRSAGGGGGLGYERPGSAARSQVSLGEQLRVGVDDKPPRDAEVGRERARRRQPRPRAKKPAACCFAKPVLQLGAQGTPIPTPELDQQLGAARKSGTRSSQ
jgi:hypothetical protein